MKIYVRPSHFRNPAQVQTELQRMTGNITFHLPGNDSFWIYLKLDVRNNNQWKENAFVFNIPGGGCTAMRTYAPEAYQTVFKRDPNLRETCTFPKGIHQINDMPLNFSFPKMAVMQYGHWRVQFTGGIRRRTTLCMMAEAKTLPKL
ncbi:hypothetical protein FOCC_FOCC017251 [Frankliniella occidentalis]|uniref:Uncharacterized protein LOC113206463 n=1 Tax=Frankliniella occidentalis TaxID=133901 RepID=A0A9C6XUN0_FRAOC|nr:uncharacterized protein LOC113206463 [Frankliniella occidentalis]KAE8737286.1 hypothetical protein FOCC_FOCC017251 [Frankliniella occidentalis]